ncbi:MAG TPA: nitronate monooxygenase [Rhizomicrobium sp.]|nr:nitronate monooxygenase [Rhizomicrobium sp.]
MFNTRITRQFKLKAPIVNAGMAFVAGPELAAAVANAGGLGLLGGAMVPPEGLRMMIHATRSMTEKNFGVDLIGDFVEDAHIDVLVEEHVSVVVFFWKAPTQTQVRKLKDGGVAFWMQIGSMDEARAAVELGAEAVVVQGSEAGGHNRSQATLSVLFAAIRDAFPRLPLIAAGGISDGIAMAAALLRGADAVLCGTRFLASWEADAHSDYKNRVVNAQAGGTAMTSVFGPEWPGQPLRALVNEAVRASAGREEAALADAKGQLIGTTEIGGVTVPVPRYSALLPTRAFDADLEWACLTAGECSANIKSVEPVSAIIAGMMKEAHALLGASARAA